MLTRRFTPLLCIPTLVLALVHHGCGRAAQSPSGDANSTSAAAGPESSKTAAIETETVTPQFLAGTILATGKVLVAEDRMANVGPVHDGRLVRIYAGQGSTVSKGQKLADLESADIDQAKADYLSALAESESARRTSTADVKLAQTTYDRTKMLYEKTIVPGKNLEAAEHDLEVAKASAVSAIDKARVALSAARSQLLILGLSESEIDSLAQKPSLAATFSLKSPIAGVVVERNATLGASVGTDAMLFRIVDTSRVWVDANVFEKDIERVKLGQDVNVSVPAYPGLTFAGKVILILTEVDPETRTVKVRTEVPNPGGKLKPDMFASAAIVTDQNRTAISVLQSAVLTDNDKTIVFVANGSDYTRREVSVGIHADDRIEITNGLSAGDVVVVKGNYLLLERSRPDQ